MYFKGQIITVSYKYADKKRVVQTMMGDREEISVSVPEAATDIEIQPYDAPVKIHRLEVHKQSMYLDYI